MESLSTVVIVIGDSLVGKTCLIHNLANRSFNENYTPTNFDKVHLTQNIKNISVHFSLWDTSGSSSYDNVRSLSYHEADVFLLCFNISDPTSLLNVKSKWIPEVKKYKSNVPVILVGTQSDRRSDLLTISQLSQRGQSPVSCEEGLAICCEIGAHCYVETSAKHRFKDENFEVLEICGLYKIESLVVKDSRHQVESNVSLPCSASSPCKKSNGPDGNSSSKSSSFKHLGLSRVTSFSAVKPLSISNESSFPPSSLFETMCISKLSDSSSFLIPQKSTIESLKSHTSLGSTGSKSSGTFSLESSKSSFYEPQQREPHHHHSCQSHSHSSQKREQYETESSLLSSNSLNFISPKAGVFRHVPAKQKKKRQNCTIM